MGRPRLTFAVGDLVGAVAILVPVAQPVGQLVHGRAVALLANNLLARVGRMLDRPQLAARGCGRSTRWRSRSRGSSSRSRGSRRRGSCHGGRRAVGLGRGARGSLGRQGRGLGGGGARLFLGRNLERLAFARPDELKEPVLI